MTSNDDRVDSFRVRDMLSPCAPVLLVQILELEECKKCLETRHTVWRGVCSDSSRVEGFNAGRVTCLIEQSIQDVCSERRVYVYMRVACGTGWANTDNERLCLSIAEFGKGR